jgi:hypothetical protein
VLESGPSNLKGGDAHNRTQTDNGGCTYDRNQKHFVFDDNGGKGEMKENLPIVAAILVAVYFTREGTNPIPHARIVEEYTKILSALQKPQPKSKKDH